MPRAVLTCTRGCDTGHLRPSSDCDWQAVETLTEVLKEVEVSKPRIPVISNVDAKPHSDPAVIKKILTQQVGSPLAPARPLGYPAPLGSPPLGTRHLTRATPHT